MVFTCITFSVRLRKNSSFKKPEEAEDKKGQRLIEKEAMETGQVRFFFLSFFNTVLVEIQIVSC